MTTREDIFGCSVTMTAEGDMSAWNDTQLAFLAHAAATPDHLGKTIASDPGFALPIICKGLFSLLLGRRELADNTTRVTLSQLITKYIIYLRFNHPPSLRFNAVMHLSWLVQP